MRIFHCVPIRSSRKLSPQSLCGFDIWFSLHSKYIYIIRFVVENSSAFVFFFFLKALLSQYSTQKLSVSFVYLYSYTEIDTEHVNMQKWYILERLFSVFFFIIIRLAVKHCSWKTIENPWSLTCLPDYPSEMEMFAFFSIRSFDFRPYTRLSDFILFWPEKQFFFPCLVVIHF